MVGIVTPGAHAVTVKPITAADIPAVAEFFHRGLSSRAPVADWCRVMTPAWEVEQPNHGYFLEENGRIVGAYHAFYSERVIEGRRRDICNLGAWCVEDGHRAAGLRLLRSLLRQRGYTFTDLTPSGNVLDLNARLGFVELDTTTALVPHMPWSLRSRGVRVVDALHEIDALLPEDDRLIYRDHASTAAQHAVLTKDGRTCYVLYRRERHLHLSSFASIVYVSDPDLFRDWGSHFYRYLLLRRAILATLAELRVVVHRPSRSVIMQGTPKLFHSADLSSSQIDYLYSELTCRPW